VGVCVSCMLHMGEMMALELVHAREGEEKMNPCAR
jgi:hypothetical protein